MGSLKDASYEEVMQLRDKMSAAEAIEMDSSHNAGIYHSLPVVIAKASGCFMWDKDGRKYYDFLACFGAANQGHCHPKILAALQEQAERITLCSRAYYGDSLAVYSKFVTDFFGYERMLPMNTGVEAAETAVKLARIWSYTKKGIPDNQAKVIFVKGNFWGRSIAAVSSSTAPTTYRHFGPYTGGFMVIAYDDVPALKAVLEAEGTNVAALMVEPLQGEAGCFVPSIGYLSQAKKLCEEHNVLFIADEIQCGLGRTGKMLCCDHEGVRPDVLVLGKALSGGVTPVSVVLADAAIMDSFTQGSHGSTYGGNPLGCATAVAALCVLRDEKLAENAEVLGKFFREEMIALMKEHSWICGVRGKGLMNAIEISPGEKLSAWDICEELLKGGILAKPTHEINVRFTPPLCITMDQMKDALCLIKAVFKEVDQKMR